LWQWRLHSVPAAYDLPHPFSSFSLAAIATSFAIRAGDWLNARGKVVGPKGAAAKLGIPRSTLDSKIKQLKIKKHELNDDQ